MSKPPLDLDWLADLIVKAVADAHAPLLARLAALERSRDALLARASAGAPTAGDNPLEARVAALETANAALATANTALEQRAQMLEQTAVKFTGVYADSRIYSPGDAATRAGGLWICTAPTTGPFDHAAWQLAVKKGDAR